MTRGVSRRGRGGVRGAKVGAGRGRKVVGKPAGRGRGRGRGRGKKAPAPSKETLDQEMDTFMQER